MPNRLLQLNVTANVGSTGTIAEGIGNVVISHGWESYVAFGRDFAGSSSHLIKVGGKPSILFHALSARVFDDVGLRSIQATEKLIRRIDEIAPSIIHLHNLHGYWLNYPLLFDYLSKRDIKVVWTLHDCWPFTGHCAHFFPIQCNKWKSGCSKCQLKKEFPASFVCDRSERNYRLKSNLFNSLGDRLTVVPVSNWLSKLVGESFLSSLPREVIYNGIDTSRFKIIDVAKKKRESFKGKKIVLGVSSGWDEWKGLSDFIKLRQLLPEEYRIVLIGLNNKQIAQLPEGISGYNILTRPDELVEFYNMADVVLSLSQAETFGLTIAESMACGTPAIVYNVTAMPELITDRVGRAVNYGEVDAVAKTIKEITAIDKHDISLICRQHVIDNFDSIQNYEKYYSLYQRILTKK